MGMEPAQAVETLKGLARLVFGRQRAFEAARDRVTNSVLQAAFEKFARESEQFVGELADEVRRLGGEPEAEPGAETPAYRPTSSGLLFSFPGQRRA